MNKRIKEKRARLSPLKIGDHVYSREEIKVIIMSVLLKVHLLPRIYAASLDPNKSNVYVWRKKNIKRTLKYMYKHRNPYLSYKHLRFARHLKPKDEFILTKPPAIIPERRTIITDGEAINYNSSAYIRFTEEIKHE